MQRCRCGRLMTVRHVINGEVFVECIQRRKEVGHDSERDESVKVPPGQRPDSEGFKV
jgi:hypothetical protein